MAEINDAMKQNSRIAAVWGGAVILLGIIAMMAPWQTGIATTLLFAILLLSAGFAKSIYAFQADTFSQGMGRFLSGFLTA